MIETYYFGCEDPFGNNAPAEVFTEKILPILKDYEIRSEDIRKIAEHIEEMCFRAYCNGETQEAWNNADYDV